MVAVYVGLIVFVRVWWKMVRVFAHHPGVRVRYLVRILVLWSLPVVVTAPMFSNDAYSYAAQGEMVSRHLSPYHYGPAILGSNKFAASVGPMWNHTPAPYGPLFLRLDGWFASLSGHDVLGTLVLLRVLELAGVALIAICLPRLARAYGRDEAEVFTLGALNPIVLLHFVGGNHNDALMVGLLLAAVTAAKEGRFLLGIVLCWFAVAIKAPAAIGVAFLGWEWASSLGSWRRRIGSILVTGAVGAAVLESFSVLSGLGWGWIGALTSPGVVHTWVTPTTSLAVAATALAKAVGVTLRNAASLEATRLAGIAVVAAISGRLLWRSNRDGHLRALGISLLLFVILGPVLQPWYLSWGIVLLVPVARGRLRAWLIVLSVASAFIGLPTSGAELLELLRSPALPLALALLAIGISAVVPRPLLFWSRRLVHRGGAGEATRPFLGENDETVAL